MTGDKCCILTIVSGDKRLQSSSTQSEGPDAVTGAVDGL